MRRSLTVPILASNASANVSSIPPITINLDYQVSPVLIGTIALIVTLLLFIAGLLYRNMRSDLEKTKATIDAELKVLDQKYNTSQKIQKMELKIQKMELNLESKSDRDDMKNHIYEINEMISKLGEEIETIKEQRDALKQDYDEKFSEIQNTFNSI